MQIVKTLSILGSTGSIGRQALEVAAWRGYKIIGLSGGLNADELIAQANRWRPRLVSCQPDAETAIRPHLPPGTKLVVGNKGTEEVALIEADAVISAIPGYAGLKPTLLAVEQGRRVALANKESMVVAGPLIRKAAMASGATITPIDSEHSALFQCLIGEDPAHIEALVLTASGGPFLNQPRNLETVTVEQALQHPNWSMGPKVTIDSATLFNKGLEILEAHFLFDIPLCSIEVVIHPESLVHGLVRFTDGSTKAQIGPHDMRLPIQVAIEYPKRPSVPLPPFRLQGKWSFLSPDLDRFPSLDLAYQAGKIGGLAPTFINAADEVAVKAFLAGKIAFPDIPKTLEAVLSQAPSAALSWDNLDHANQEAKLLAADVVAAFGR